MPHRSDAWQTRWAAIEAILSGGVVHSQDELLRALRARGFTVTQSSVSRDLREMGVAKVDGRYVPGRELGGGGGSADLRAVTRFVTSVETAGPNLLVLKTTTGTAQTVGIAVDRERWPEIVGTVAGDDTMFIAVKNRTHQAHVEARLAALMKEPEGE